MPSFELETICVLFEVIKPTDNCQDNRSNQPDRPTLLFSVVFATFDMLKTSADGLLGIADDQKCIRVHIADHLSEFEDLRPVYRAKHHAPFGACIGTGDLPDAGTPLESRHQGIGHLPGLIGDDTGGSHHTGTFQGKIRSHTGNHQHQDRVQSNFPAKGEYGHQYDGSIDGQINLAERDAGPALNDPADNAGSANGTPPRGISNRCRFR